MIVVTLNYRLGALGFLCLGSDVVRNVFRKKTVLCGKNSHVGRPLPPLPQYGNFFDEILFLASPDAQEVIVVTESVSESVRVSRLD